MNKRLLCSIVGVVATGAPAPAAHATVSAQLVQIAIGAPAKTADPNLNNFTSYDLRVTVTGQNAAGNAPADWTSADLRALLTAGTFYVPAAGNGNTANSAFWALAPNLEYDTFVTAPNFGATTVLGRFQPPGGAGTETFSATDVNVSYGDLANTGNGTFTIARLTVSNGAVGTVSGNVYDSFGGNAPTPFTATIPVPEPTTLGLAGAALGLLATRGRRRRRTA
jgi:hypothetical protein